MKKPRLILASTSPRRIDLLKQAGFKAEVKSPDADETPLEGETPRALVTRLAREKAFSVARKNSAGSAQALVIAADTIVVAGGRTGKKSGVILGKPRDKKDARKMLALLSGRWHHVLTGYCILPVDGSGELGRSVTRVVVSSVQIKALSSREITEYIATGEPMDKAGSYAAQGRGMALIESIRGSYTNVVGLPMCQLLRDLHENFGVDIFQ